MKKTYYISTLLLLSLLCFSCDNYFDVELKQDIPSDGAYASVRAVQGGVNGTYRAFGNYKFHGRNAVALGDVAADMAEAGTSGGHFLDIWKYTITTETSDPLYIWQFGYAILDRATRTINGANELLASGGGLTDKEVEQIHNYIAQCHSLRAITNHILVQVFGLPYGTDSNANGGIVLVDKEPIEYGQKVSRSSVSQTYDLILKDILSAKNEFALAPSITNNQYYITPAAVAAIEARVHLHMKMYPEAVAAAKSALTLRGGGDVDNIKYLVMWKDLAISDEDIFTIVKSGSDNLSANSLNTLYGTYGSILNTNTVSLFKLNDVRLKLINSSDRKPLKHIGTSEGDAVSNIPVFRKSEMYLIIAEAYAQQNSITDAQKALFYTAKRDTDIMAESMLPATQADLLGFIAEERCRELFQEGFRWYDVRRTGEIISVNSGGYTNFDVSKFVYPIPSYEINSNSGVQQTEGWHNALPK